MSERNRNLPMLQQQFNPLDIHCGNCSAACCSKGIGMPLSEAEVSTLQAAGTSLRYDKPEEIGRLELFARRAAGMLGWYVPPPRSFYVFESDCGNLYEDPDTKQLKCSIYGEPERPIVCEAFKSAEYPCMVVRVEAGVNTEADLEAFDQITRC